uniref:MAM domain-containing protein n=1 Tax=Caenorhabditis japonica TaxID=281687 RepID=A0A8R1I227_CAEJA
MFSYFSTIVPVWSSNSAVCVGVSVNTTISRQIACLCRLTIVSFVQCTPQCCGCSQAQQPVAPQPAAAAARVAAAGKTPIHAIDVQGSSVESLLGQKVSVTEFTADGYNAEGGGPVQSGNALTCNFDGKPCCWANIPSPDDQLDWQIASGVPVQLQNRGVPQNEGSYLIAYAKSAAPSDEAQFASCSIGCTSSDIVIRAKHWQSESVLLQVCLRESFPTNAERNPLINCQEFPFIDGMGTTEVILPKTSLVDIVFVASNFIGDQGDVAIIDDIEVSYDRNGAECQNEFQEGSDGENNEELTNRLSGNQESKTKRKELFGKPVPEGKVLSASERFGSGGFKGGEKAFGGPGSKFGGSFESASHGNAAVGTSHTEETVFASVKTAKLPSGHAVAKGAKTADFSEVVCNATKCDFEAENACGYSDAHTTQSIRGLTTKFNVVSGQFMNRVTGIKESTEGEFYAATFLFPREMAGLEATVQPFTEQSRIRFHYYEGTHGVQLKGCCSTIENCPFSSDKFVTVADRAWKTAAFKCPKGTDKVIFICENTRTNQGACAVDGIGLVENNGSLKTAKPLC